MHIKIKVKTGQKESEVEKLRDGDFLVKVKSRPVENEANVEVVKLLSEYFGTGKYNIIITSGHKSASKYVEIRLDSRGSHVGTLPN